MQAANRFPSRVQRCGSALADGDYGQSNLNEQHFTLAKIVVGADLALEPVAPDGLHLTLIAATIQVDDILGDLVFNLVEVSFLVLSDTLVAQVKVGLEP